MKLTQNPKDLFTLAKKLLWDVEGLNQNVHVTLRCMGIDSFLINSYSRFIVQNEFDKYMVIRRKLILNNLEFVFGTWDLEGLKAVEQSRVLSESEQANFTKLANHSFTLPQIQQGIVLDGVDYKMELRIPQQREQMVFEWQLEEQLCPSSQTLITFVESLNPS